jgi:hypothetical protein
MFDIQSKQKNVMQPITINGKEHFLHSAEGESDFLFALMRPVKALRLVREQKVLSPRGVLLPFFTLLISTGERNAFGEEALSAAALDPFDGKEFHYGRDLFCKGGGGMLGRVETLAVE